MTHEDVSDLGSDPTEVAAALDREQWWRDAGKRAPEQVHSELDGKHVSAVFPFTLHPAE